ncbi:carbohydrate ABC transporter permease [Propylenella binzhouense]|uniref:sn-glycerol-3-phosphate transport system permease protein UgpE n=1 Tax=Propylenella binzhouense TaxID=2555902 RepID=A0A964WU39_9HYPH|nr:carbohydrate ABC transporter permease [Propylenella binzhouense]MYZ48455.1 carbohydrate ABC transporter permease [Propylenella binzhouense]
MHERRRRRLAGAARYAALTLIFVVLILPLYWFVMSSFRPVEDIFRYANDFGIRTLVPTRITLQNHIAVFRSEFTRALFNSLFVCTTTVALSVFVNSMAGFAFAVFEFRFKNVLFVLVLLSFMMPFESIVIPLYSISRALGLVNTYGALILPEAANGLVIFLFRQFFLAIPRDIYEAARVDGASWWQIYLRMTLPLSGPTVAAASLLIFIHQWDAFFWPLIAASSPELVVVQVAVARNMSVDQTNWGVLFSSASIAVAVALVPFLLLQRYYVRVVGLGRT